MPWRLRRSSSRQLPDSAATCGQMRSSRSHSPARPRSPSGGWRSGCRNAPSIRPASAPHLGMRHRAQVLEVQPGLASPRRAPRAHAPIRVGRKPRGRQAAARRRRRRPQRRRGHALLLPLHADAWRMLSLSLGASWRSTTSKLSASTTAKRLVLQSTRRPTAAIASSRSRAASRPLASTSTISQRGVVPRPRATMQGQPISALVIQLQRCCSSARGGTPP